MSWCHHALDLSRCYISRALSTEAEHCDIVNKMEKLVKVNDIKAMVCCQDREDPLSFSDFNSHATRHAIVSALSGVT